MFFFTFLAAFLLTVRIRRALKFSPIFPKWRTALTASGWIIMGLWLLFNYYFDSEVNEILGALVLLGLLLYLKKEPDFKSFEVLLFAHYPLVIIAFVNGVVSLAFPDFFDKWDNFFVCAQLVAFGWIFARFATSKKQQEEIKRINERKSELEVLVVQRTAEITKTKKRVAGCA
jgi:two-component system NtrC family sensor kinase